jgi:F-box domain
MSKRGNNKRKAEAAESSGVNLFSLVPVDVMWYLFKFLSPRDIFLFASCCRSLRALLTARRSDELRMCLFPRSNRDDVFSSLLSLSTSFNKVGKRVTEDLEGLVVRCVASSGQSCFAGAKNAAGVVVCWNKDEKFERGKRVNVSEKKTSVNSLCSKNGRLFVGVSKPTCAVHCVDVESGKVLCQFQGLFYPPSLSPLFSLLYSLSSILSPLFSLHSSLSIYLFSSLFSLLFPLFSFSQGHKDSVFAIAVNQRECLSGGGQNDKVMKCSDLETQTVLWVQRKSCEIYLLAQFCSDSVFFSWRQCARS